MTFQLDTSGEVALSIAEGIPAAVAGGHRWSDLSPFCQGYIEAMFAEAGFVRVNRGGEELPFGFSDLAPVTLARIIADCERFSRDLGPGWEGHGPGQQFWRVRSEEFDGFGPIAGPDLTDRFPPLTVTHGDDGLIYLRAGQ